MNHPERPSDDVVKELMRKVNHQVPGAEAELMKFLSPWLLDLIRQKLDQRVRRIEDSWDILQEALMVVADNFAKRNGWSAEKFLRVMEKVILRKTLSANRRHLDCQKRQDVRFVDFSAQFNEEHQPFSHGPEPFAEAQAQETWERLIEKSPEPAKTLLRMKAEGYSDQEIAERIHVHERTIRKMVDVLRQKFPGEVEMKKPRGGGGVILPQRFRLWLQRGITPAPAGGVP